MNDKEDSIPLEGVASRSQAVDWIKHRTGSIMLAKAATLTSSARSTASIAASMSSSRFWPVVAEGLVV